MEFVLLNLYIFMNSSPFKNAHENVASVSVMKICITLSLYLSRYRSCSWITNNYQYFIVTVFDIIHLSLRRRFTLMIQLCEN